VFDRDEHSSYSAAIEKVRQLDCAKKNKERTPIVFRAVPSNPCFELWYLLHFVDHSRDTSRDEVYRLLK